MMHVTKELKDYIEQQILPIYEKNDTGHGIEHIKYVVLSEIDEYNRSLKDLQELFETSVDDSILLDTSSMGMDEVSIEFASQIMPAMRKKVY